MDVGKNYECVTRKKGERHLFERISTPFTPLLLLLLSLPLFHLLSLSLFIPQLCSTFNPKIYYVSLFISFVIVKVEFGRIYSSVVLFVKMRCNLEKKLIG